ncbi:MAG: methionine--tRNA ligase [Chloroflexi bacterium]|nr:methionine--tRNA ligase [Chloroflexota bacterium]
MSRYYITTPIYYVNDVPHIGHAYTTVAADVLSRYYRADGADVLFLTGTDEHGAKVAAAAEARGESPQVFVDLIVDRFISAWKDLSISNDTFIRTSSDRHKAGAQAFLMRLYDSGYIYKGVYDGLYCVGCERFLTEPELTSSGLCPDHQRAPVPYSEENWFFRLSAFGDQILRAISNPKAEHHFSIEPSARKNEILGKLRLGLQDISISRKTVEWGIPLPWDRTQTCYVWVEALMNYVTAIGYHDDRETFLKYWPADLHLMAKEILWFHTVIWPAMLMAIGLPTPKKVYAHGFFTLNGRKMSKSLGNVVSPTELVERFGVDASRYLLLSEFPFGIDGNISLDSFASRYHADLANDLGNLLNRTVNMVNRYLDGACPAAPAERSPEDRILADVAGDLSQTVRLALDRLEFTGATDAIRATVSRTNRYVDVTQPWVVARTDRARVSAILYHLIETLRLIGIELLPFMPNRAASLLTQIGVPAAAAGTRTWGGFADWSRVVQRPEPLFPRLDT